MHRKNDKRPKSSRDDRNLGRKNDKVPHQLEKEIETSKIGDYHLRPKLADYKFNVSTTDLVVMLRQMGEIVRWQKEMRMDPYKHIHKFWCEFQSDHYYKTFVTQALKGIHHL